jgi:hypothetical protein
MNESTVHEFYFKNQPPTLSLLLVALHNVPSHPDFKRKELGTVYWKKQNKAIMTGRNDASE